MTQAHSAFVLTLLFWGTAGEPEARGQIAGTFSATGSMITPRFGHMATLLPNGKVLIAGGIRSVFSNPNLVLAQTAPNCTIQ